MSNPTPHTAPVATSVEEIDAVDAIVPMIPVVLPLVGALMIFLLAMIAVTMA